MTLIKRSSIVDPGIESILECSIETASEYQLGQPIAIKGTLHNSGSSGVWVLSWNTLLDSDWQDCVLLSHEGSSVPRTGIIVTRLAPSRDAYILIPPGESVSRQIDLTQKYAIAELGDYEVSFYMRIHGALAEGSLEPPADEKGIQVTLVESAKASFRVSGDASLRNNLEALVWSPSATSSQAPFPTQPKEPTYSGFTQEQQEMVHRAYFTAYNNILKALDSTKKSIDVNSNALYAQWFDCPGITGRYPGWEQRRSKVIDTLSNMAYAMSSDPPIAFEYIQNDPNCKFDTIAYAYLNSRRAGICPLFFNKEALELLHWDSAEWVRAYSLVHEISHAAAITQDIRYLWTLCEALAWLYPDEAVVNANNYALYVMLREGGHLPMTSRYAVRCYDRKRDKFLGWLSQGGNWVYLTGNDPDNPNDPTTAGRVTVYWNEKYICPTYASRYLSDDGDGNPGASAAFNLWARSHELDYTEPDCRIFKKDNSNICLALNLNSEDKKVIWGTLTAPGGVYTILRCEFIEV